jgi:hypothetical protein
MAASNGSDVLERVFKTVFSTWVVARVDYYFVCTARASNA